MSLRALCLALWSLQSAAESAQVPVSWGKTYGLQNAIDVASELEELEEHREAATEVLSAISNLVESTDVKQLAQMASVASKFIPLGSLVVKEAIEVFKDRPDLQVASVLEGYAPASSALQKVLHLAKDPAGVQEDLQSAIAKLFSVIKEAKDLANTYNQYGPWQRYWNQNHIEKKSNEVTQIFNSWIKVASLLVTVDARLKLETLTNKTFAQQLEMSEGLQQQSVRIGNFLGTQLEKYQTEHQTQHQTQHDSLRKEIIVMFIVILIAIFVAPNMRPIATFVTPCMIACGKSVCFKRRPAARNEDDASCQMQSRTFFIPSGSFLSPA